MWGNSLRLGFLTDRFSGDIARFRPLSLPNYIDIHDFLFPPKAYFPIGIIIAGKNPHAT
jgi:hypothetical protein